MKRSLHIICRTSVPPLDSTALDATLIQIDFAVSKEGQDIGPMQR